MSRYIMQARASTNGSLVMWASTKADFAGDDYPGPGSPQEVAVAFRPPPAGTTYGLFADRPAPGSAGLIYYCTDGGLAFLDDGTAWRPLLPGNIVGTAPPVASNWTSFHSPTSLTDSNGALLLVGPSDASAVYTRGYTLNGSSGQYVEAAFAHEVNGVNTSADNGDAVVSVVLRESATDKQIQFGIGWYYLHTAAGPQFFISAAVWASSTSRTSEKFTGLPVDGGLPQFFRLRVSSGNVLVEMSRNRKTWTQFESVAVASVFTTAPDQAGITTLGYQGNGAVPQALVTHFRSSP